MAPRERSLTIHCSPHLGGYFWPLSTMQLTTLQVGRYNICSSCMQHATRTYRPLHAPFVADAGLDSHKATKLRSLKSSPFQISATNVVNRWPYSTIATPHTSVCCVHVCVLCACFCLHACIVWGRYSCLAAAVRCFWSKQRGY